MTTSSISALGEEAGILDLHVSFANVLISRAGLVSWRTSWRHTFWLFALWHVRSSYWCCRESFRYCSLVIHRSKYEGTAGGHVLLTRTTTSSPTGSSLLFYGRGGSQKKSKSSWPLGLAVLERWTGSSSHRTSISFAHRSPAVSILQRPLAGTGSCLWSCCHDREVSCTGGCTKSPVDDVPCRLVPWHGGTGECGLLSGTPS